MGGMTGNTGKNRPCPYPDPAQNEPECESSCKLPGIEVEEGK